MDDRGGERERETTKRITIEPVRGTTGGARRGVLTVLSGPRMGLVLEIADGALEIGRAAEGPLALGDDSLSRRHARFFEAHGAAFVEDLHSTNGTFLDGRRISEPERLADGAVVQLGKSTILRFTLRDEAEVELSHRTYEATVRDGLTGLYNRAFLDERLTAELAYARRHGTPLAVLFVDADHFKKVNDTYGHAAGDTVLTAIARFLKAAVRTEDVAARYGGEEFVLALRGIEEPGVRTVADRIRMGIAGLVIVHEGMRIPVTVSVGVTLQTKDRLYASTAELLAAADAALYRAKESGRNRVVFG